MFSVDKFDGVLYVVLESGGVLCFVGVSVCFVCCNVGYYVGGDYLFFIGEIEWFDVFGKVLFVFYVG